MPRKAEVTPTVTEGRSKRTPKPNLKYALDFVQTVRAATPDRPEEDDEYKPAPKKRLLDESATTSPKSAVKGKMLQPQIRLSKVGVNESPKTPVRKTPGKVEKKSTPVPSKLATIKAGLIKQGLPLVKAIGRQKSTPTAKASASETESDVGEAPSPKETRMTRSGPTRGTPPTTKAAAPSPTTGKTGALAQKTVQKAPPQKVIPQQKATPPPAKPAAPKAVIRTAAAPLKTSPAASKAVPAKLAQKPSPKPSQPPAKVAQAKTVAAKKPAVQNPTSDIEIDEMFEDPFGDDSFGEPSIEGDEEGFQFVDIAKIIGGGATPKRKADTGDASSKSKRLKQDLIDFEDEISAANVQRAKPKAPAKQTSAMKSPPVVKKEPPKVIMKSKEQKKPEVTKPLARKETAQRTVNAKASPPVSTKRTSSSKEETINDISAEISKMVSEKKPRAAQKKSVSDSFDVFDDDDDEDDIDEFGEEETDTDEDIEAILSGVKSPETGTKGKAEVKKSPAAGKKAEQPKEKSKETTVTKKVEATKKPTETATAKPKETKMPPKPVIKTPVSSKGKSPELIKKIMKPLTESQNLKSATASSSAVTPKVDPVKSTPSDKLFCLNFPNISSQPPRAVLCLSLIKLGNRIKEIKLPSLNWSYRITLQKLNNKENADKSEVYTGDIQDSGIDESERGSYAPVNISFQRVVSAETPNSDTIKTVTFQNKSFQILLKGKACRLIGSPQYIYDVSEIQTLLEIVEKVDPQHSYVESAEIYGK